MTWPWREAYFQILGLFYGVLPQGYVFFTADTLHNIKPGANSRFINGAALLTAYLMIDDFFQIHEKIIPRFFGFDEIIIYVVLGMVIITFLVAYRRIIAQTNHTMLLLALGFLGTSVAADGIFAPMEIIYALLGTVIAVSVCLIAFNQTLFRAYSGVLLLISGLCVVFVAIKSGIDQPEYLLEDGTKWLGIACWCSYYVHTSHQFIAGALSEKSANQEICIEAEFTG